MTQREIALELGWTVDRVKYYLNKMKKMQVTKRVVELFDDEYP